MRTAAKLPLRASRGKDAGLPSAYRSDGGKKSWGLTLIVRTMNGGQVYPVTAVMTDTLSGKGCSVVVCILKYLHIIKSCEAFL